MFLSNDIKFSFKMQNVIATLQAWCFHVKLSKFLRTPFFREPLDHFHWIFNVLSISQIYYNDLTVSNKECFERNGRPIRDLSNIFDVAFLLIFFEEKFHHSYVTGSQIRLWKLHLISWISLAVPYPYLFSWEILNLSISICIDKANF